MRERGLKIISLLEIFLLLLLFVIQPKVLASSASASLSAGKTTLKVGESTSISVSISNTETYSLSINANGGNLGGNTSSADAFGEETSKTVLNANFSASTAGTYSISLSGTVASSDLNIVNISKSITITVIADTTPQENSGSSTNNNNNNSENTQNNSSNNSQPVTGAETSQDTNTPQSSSQNNNEATNINNSNNYLKSLSIGTGTLEPRFYRETTNYTVKFNDDFDFKNFNSINIYATAEDSKAKISGTGTISINDGENNIAIRVTAENGSVRTYNIKIDKPVKIQQSDMRLKTLEISTISKDNQIELAKLNQDFDPEIFEYSINVGEDITDLDINANVEKQGIIVIVEGNKNLTIGENEVTIKLILQDDDSIQTTYKIKVNKAKSDENELINEETDDKIQNLQNDKKKRIIKGICILIGILFLIAIVLLILNKKMKNKGIPFVEYENDDDDDAYNGNEDYDDYDENQLEEKDAFSKKRIIRRKSKTEANEIDEDINEYNSEDIKEKKQKRTKGKHF